MFPYPSGDGLHVGHPEGLHGHRHRLPLRPHARQVRDAPHGLGRLRPARRAARQADRHPPRITTEKNIANFRRQLKMLGFSYDWDRELATTDLDYFRWTQWIFLVLFDTWYDAAEQAAAGRSPSCRFPPKWRPQGEAAVAALSRRASPGLSARSAGQLVPGAGHRAGQRRSGRRSERARRPSVVRIPLRQWMLRITAYADRLEKDLDGLDWSESIKLLQRNWIGRSTGAEVDFFIGREPRPTAGRPEEFEAWSNDRDRSADSRSKPGDDVLRIYTTRPDTLFGATYMVIAPEHPLVQRLTLARPGRSGAGLLRPGGAQERPGPHRPGQGQDRRVHRLVSPSTRSTARRFRSGWPTTCWPATAPARSWPCRPTTRATSNSPSSSSCRSCRWSIRADATPSRLRDEVLAGQAALTADGTADQLRPLQRPDHGRVQARDRRRPGSQGHGPRSGQLQAPRLALQPPAFLGRAVPDPARTRRAAGKPTGLVRAVPRRAIAGRSARHAATSSRTTAPSRRWSKRRRTGCTSMLDGRRYKRETNTMPQWAGSCWYYLRFLDPKNDRGLRRSARWKRPGCRSICTSAGPSMPCCTCSMPASGTRCSSTAATSARPSRSRSWSTRG